MATHAFYDYQPLPGDKLRAEGLSPRATRYVTTYANAVAAFDAAMRRLLGVLGARKRPTIVAIFGDHQPLLGDDYEAYRELGVPDGEVGLEDLIRFSRVPVWLWWNDAAEPGVQQRLPDVHLGGGLATLGSVVAQAAGLPLTSLDVFTREAADRFPVFRADVVQAADGRIWEAPSLVDDPALRSWVRRWELIAYDALFGEREVVTSDEVALRR
jgi:hypothetical protein